MGLIQAFKGALGGQLADQWKEFFYCDAIPADVLVVKGQKKTTARSSNTKGEENIISNGSRIAVNNGQCMIIVESGKVVELCAEPGEFTYDSGTEHSFFDGGNLGQNFLNFFKQFGDRFTFGGQPGKDQRVYYFNIKEIIGNKYGTPRPVPFRVVDQRAGIDIDVSRKTAAEAMSLAFFTAMLYSLVIRLSVSSSAVFSSSHIITRSHAPMPASHVPAGLPYRARRRTSSARMPASCRNARLRRNPAFSPARE